MIEAVFVILHYNEKSLKDTYECVESIKRITNKKESKIIIVENGSFDKSAENLIEKYKFDKMIEIVISKENLGFAKGNNLGCKIAIEKYFPEFLVVLNNDTYIEQEDFLKKLKLIYKIEKFHILGPYIFNKNLEPQNPQVKLLTNIDEVEKALEKSKKILINIENTNVIYFFIESLKRIIESNKFLEKIIKKILGKEKETVKYANKKLKNIGLHGSCLIFSREYYKKYNNIFYPETFLYVEEDILYHRVLKDNLVSLYHPELKIFHKEDVSTDAMLFSSNQKKKFIIKNIIKSLEIYRDLLKNEKRESEGL